MAKRKARKLYSYRCVCKTIYGKTEKRDLLAHNLEEAHRIARSGMTIKSAKCKRA